MYSGWSRWKEVWSWMLFIVDWDCLFQVCIPVDFVHKGTFPSREALFMLVKFEFSRYKRWMRDGHRDEIWPNFDSFLRFSTLFPRLWVYTLRTCVYMANCYNVPKMDKTRRVEQCCTLLLLANQIGNWCTHLYRRTDVHICLSHEFCHHKWDSSVPTL